MSHANASVVLLAASLFAPGESSLAPHALLHGEALEYVTADASVRSSLAMSAVKDSVSLHAVTELPGGSRLTEEARTDASGKLVRAVLTFEQPGADLRTRVMLDATQGVVTLRAPTLEVRWLVPTDLPWIWAPLKAPGGSAAYATPLQAQVALAGAAGDRPVRVLDFARLHSFTLMADQLVSRDAQSGGATVVLGDDFAEIADDRPRRVHISAIDRDLELVDAAPVVPVRADCMRAQPASSFTL